MIKKLAIGFLGGPGCGKTTASVGLYNRLKKEGLEVELVSEFAKELILENNKTALSYQKYVWATQCYRMYCAYKRTQLVITDAPILLGAIYNENISQSFLDVILEEHHKFNNINIIVPRDLSRPYSMAGRIHSLTESIAIDNRIINLLEINNIPYITLNEVTENDLVEIILKSINF